MNFETTELKFDQQGLIPAIVQDANTLEVLTLAYMNRQSLARTVETGETWFWSRSRNQLWHKGETSGNTQRVVELLLDCDQDALVVLVEPAGPACHKGDRTCFHKREDSKQIEGSNAEANDLVRERDARAPVSGTPVENGEEISSAHDLGGLLDQLYAVIESRERERPAGSYTTYLFNEGLDKILKKVGEESTETIVAAKNPDSEPLVAETSDLLYHLLVLLVARGITLDEIRLELVRRQR
jgi:phosphoribosyl-ATP pyrophosphohydrolase/phosphoribosyl-AMP cyclohydrolase